MKLKNLTPIFWTEDLEATTAFYTNTLGFQCKEFDKKWGWASLEKDNVNVMLAKPNEHIPFEKPIFTGTVYFQTDDVEKMWDEIKENVKICYPLETFEWGMREFAIYDNNGYMLQFGQEI